MGLISILIPIYNVEKYLLETLISIKNQTYINFEVILIDDNSSDNTFIIAKTFSLHDKRFKVFKNNTHKNIAFSLNQAFKFSSGDYIARCDGDDVMLNDRLETQLKYLLSNNIDLVGNSFITIDENGNFLNKRHFPSGFNLLKEQIKYISPVSHIWLSRREVYETIGLYRLSSVEDYDFLYRVLIHGFKIDNIDNYYGMKIRIREYNTVSLYGLAQRRLFNYAKKINENNLIYDSDIEQKIIISSLNGFCFKMHKFSDILTVQGSKLKCMIFKYFLYIISGAISVYKLQYFNRILISNILCYVYKSRK